MEVAGVRGATQIGNMAVNPAQSGGSVAGGDASRH